MQQTQKTIYEKSSIGFLGTAWIAGLLIAGSDSQYMPWINGIGLLLFFGASVLLGKLLKPSHSTPGILLYPEFYQRPPAKAMELKKRNQSVNIGYALGL